MLCLYDAACTSGQCCVEFTVYTDFKRKFSSNVGSFTVFGTGIKVVKMIHAQSLIGEPTPHPGQPPTYPVTTGSSGGSDPSSFTV